MHISNTFVRGSRLLLLASIFFTGCATKKYVAQQTSPIQQRIEEVDKKHAQALAQLEAKERQDVSRVEERAIAAEGRADEAGRAAQTADQKAMDAREAAQKAADAARAAQDKLGGLADEIGNIDNFKAQGSEQILFRFNADNLSADAQAKLDQLVQKVSGLKRYVIEVKGFTDTAGAPDFNLALSRRRADAVVRHLVDHGVPLRRIHMLGLGSEQTQEGGAALPRQQQRRVTVTLWAP